MLFLHLNHLKISIRINCFIFIGIEKKQRRQLSRMRLCVYLCIYKGKAPMPIIKAGSISTITLLFYFRIVCPSIYPVSASKLPAIAYCLRRMYNHKKTIANIDAQPMARRWYFISTVEESSGPQWTCRTEFSPKLQFIFSEVFAINLLSYGKL